MDNANTTTEVYVSLPYDTPVVGIEFKPCVRLDRRVGGKWCDPPEHEFKHSWFREQIFCSVHCFEIATVQCKDCVTLNLPIRESYHCSRKCFSGAWNCHVARHCHATETVSGRSNDDDLTLRCLGTWPTLDLNSFHKSLLEFERKMDAVVGSSETYVPSMDDSRHTLRLVSEAVDRLGHPLALRKVIVTEPVVIAPTPQPRCMIEIGPNEMSRNFEFSTESSGPATFSVLSYNILSNMYCTKEVFSHCPAWALAWEYRQKNLLQEIIRYNADILCLQEVQSNHFDNFYKPELTKHGYSVFYKPKNNQMFVEEKQLAIDGCATFFRDNKFKALFHNELEFEDKAQLMIGNLEPNQKQKASFHLKKDNIALLVVLELKNSKIRKSFRSICVANTHIHSNSSLSDVQLFQVATLITTLDNFAGTPVLLCGDMNSLPGSDPYKFLVTGSLDPLHTADYPLGICSHLKLQHSIHLASAYSSLLQSGRVEDREKQKMNLETKEPLFTRSIPTSSETLDYIFYSGTCLMVEGLLELLDSKSLGGDGLPSQLWSSDHIALMANFSIHPPSDRTMYPPHPCQQPAAW